MTTDDRPTVADEIRRHVHAITKLLCPNGGIERPVQYAAICDYVGVAP